MQHRSQALLLTSELFIGALGLVLTMACAGHDAPSATATTVSQDGDATSTGPSAIGSSTTSAEQSASSDDSPSHTTEAVGTSDHETDGCSAQALAALEQQLSDAFDDAAQDASITADPNATLLLAADDGRLFVHSHGDSSAARVYESASTSKWIAATVILNLVDQGVMTLDTTTSDLLDFWPAPGVPLRNLLAFTSGFDDDAPCLNLPSASFAACVQMLYDAGVMDETAPGTVFQYSSSHLQIAGLMAMRAANADSWSEVFAAWQADTGLFPNGAFDLPSADNPRLAGGMHWRGDEYLAFLQAVRHGELLSDSLGEAMMSNQRGNATVGTSPSLAGWGEDWAYGFGNWVECSTATTGAGSYNCGHAGQRNSSPGAYGAYPIVDAQHGFVAVLARQGTLGTAREGLALYRSVDDLVIAWAAGDCGI